MRPFQLRSLGYSIGFHLVLFTALFLFFPKPLKWTSPKSEITLLLHSQVPTSSNSHSHGDSRSNHGPDGSLSSHAKSTPHTFDLRPSFAKNFGNGASQPSTGTENSLNHAAQDLLHTDGRSLQAFDQLALMINGHLDYPEMLAENGVQGTATLDVYFDHDAHVDETRTRIVGDNRWIRGLFVKAARTGLEDWFRGMGGTLNKSQFRDQHFRADFVITYTNTHLSELEKSGESSYHLARRQLVQTCLNPAAGGLDLACAAMRVAGAVSSKVSSNYKSKYEALKDKLEQFDEMGLSGINQSISHRQET